MKYIQLLILLVSLSTSVKATDITWTNHIIGDIYTCWSAFAIDLDEDGDTDVLGTSNWDNQVAWWENDGSDVKFSIHYLSETFDSATAIEVLDFDKDGDLDIIATSLTGNIYWWENDGSENFTEDTIATGYSQIYDAKVLDIDGDTDYDIVIARYDGSDTTDIYWFRQDSLPTFFTPLPVTSVFNGAQSIFAIDIGDDDNIDLVAGSHTSGYVGWAENDGSENFTLYVLELSADSCRAVWADDLDSDGDIDILATAQWDGDLIWLENDGSETFVRHYIDRTLAGPWDIATADIDGDASIDIIGTEFGRLSLWDTTGIGGGDNVVWWENDGSESFTRHNILTRFDGAKSVYPIDFDEDGDIDVVASACWETTIGWNESDLATRFDAEDITDMAVKAMICHSQAYPMGGDYGIPKVIQGKALATDSLTIADSILFKSWVEFSIDATHWCGNDGSMGIDSTTLMAFSDTITQYIPIVPSAAWQWYRIATRAEVGCDLSGDVRAGFNAAPEFNTVRR